MSDPVAAVKSRCTVGPRSTSTISTAKCRNSMPSGRSAFSITAAARQCARRSSKPRARGEA
ncbi:hypothetical protein [Streptomyces albiflavescens]|uniref:hypothetical protein n=1 Tax=Streptomyces albiflavescens TaxID=1623582 RepID=UPI00166C6F4E|nr:hypothetical protein [Streptomyces albiflavescens]